MVHFGLRFAGRTRSVGGFAGQAGGERRARRLRPGQPERLEGRAVPAIDPSYALSAGLVEVAGQDPATTNGFTYDHGDVCATIQLTQKGINTLTANANDGNPNNDTIDVGVASYMLTDGSAAHVQDLSKQVMLEASTGALSLANRSQTFCVAVDDVLCTQVDAFTGAPFDFQAVGNNFDRSRLLGGAIFMDGMVETTSLTWDPPHDCPNIQVGNQGLTVGYWKNHYASWQVYTPDTKLGDILHDVPAALANDTFATALSYSGGPTVLDADKLMLKQAVAALLNAANDGVAYPLTTGQIKVMVNNAMESGDRATILGVASLLDGDNSLEGVSLGGANNNQKS